MDARDVIENNKKIFLTDSSLVSLLDFERVLDELDLYVFKNWMDGELVEGPIYTKYWVECAFMWPYKLMPDPRGGIRLLPYDCQVTYQKDDMITPIKIETPSDFRPGTKKAKLEKKPIWIVRIKMPKKLMQEIYQGFIELEGETVDLDDIDSAYEDNLDKEGLDQENDDEGDANNPNPFELEDEQNVEL